MKIILSVLFFISSLELWACHIELPERILIVENNNSDVSYQNVSDCTKHEQDKLHEILISTEGKITALQMMRMTQIQHDLTITVAPHLIQIDHLNHIARSQLPLPQSIFVKEIRAAIGMKALYPIKNGDQITVSCQDCLYGLNQKLQLTHEPFIGDRVQHNLTINFGKLTKAYKLTQNIASFSSLNSKDLYQEDYIEVIPQVELVQDGDSLKHFKNNKPLKAGEYLKRSDIIPTNLVRAGDKTEIIFENSAVSIKTDGIARNNGGFGDSVEVYLPAKNKKYLGKIIDDHKVVIEL